MEIQPLAHMIEDLLFEASDDGLEACLCEAPLDAEADPAPLRAEYEIRYAHAVRSVSKQRGEPVFSGAFRSAGYPGWHRADLLTHWNDATGTGTIYVALSVEAQAIRLLVGARPHPVEREAITLLPPA